MKSVNSPNAHKKQRKKFYDDKTIQGEMGAAVKGMNEGTVLVEQGTQLVGQNHPGIGTKSSIAPAKSPMSCRK